MGSRIYLRLPKRVHTFGSRLEEFTFIRVLLKSVYPLVSGWQTSKTHMRFMDFYVYVKRVYDWSKICRFDNINVLDKTRISLPPLNKKTR